MKSKNLLYLLILLAVLVAAFFLLKKDPKTTLSEGRRDFAVEDTSVITKIFIANKDQKQVLLERKADGKNWTVNGQYEANMYKVNLLLSTMAQLEVKTPVPDVDHNIVVKNLASSGRKVEIYEGEKLVKTYYVGTPTADELGTFMLMEDSDIPYIIHIPGFNGYLTVRYFIEEKDWRTRSVFSYGYNDLASVKIDYPTHPEHSFTINVNGEESTIVPEISSIQKLENPDQSMLSYYASLFDKLNHEGYDIGEDTAKVDSIYNTQPFCIIRLQDKAGSAQSLRIHNKPVDKRTIQQSDDSGNPLTVDVERYYGFMGEEKDMILLQDYVFNRVFRRYQDFETLPDKALVN